MSVENNEYLRYLSGETDTNYCSCPKENKDPGVAGLRASVKRKRLYSEGTDKVETQHYCPRSWMFIAMAGKKVVVS